MAMVLCLSPEALITCPLFQQTTKTLRGRIINAMLTRDSIPEYWMYLSPRTSVQNKSCAIESSISPKDLENSLLRVSLSFVSNQCKWRSLKVFQELTKDASVLLKTCMVSTAALRSCVLSSSALSKQETSYIM